MDKKHFDQLMNVLKEIRDQEETISKKLSILMMPLFKREGKKQIKKVTQTNIKTLDNCGLDYKEIANILCMSPGTVANELTVLRGKRRGGKNAKKD